MGLASCSRKWVHSCFKGPNTSCWTKWESIPHLYRIICLHDQTKKSRGKQVMQTSEQAHRNVSCPCCTLQAHTQPHKSLFTFTVAGPRLSNHRTAQNGRTASEQSLPYKALVHVTMSADFRSADTYSSLQICRPSIGHNILLFFVLFVIKTVL